MAEFAKLDENNVVIAVVAVDDIKTSDNNGTIVEEIGIQHLINTFGWTKWKIDNRPTRVNFPSVNGRYDENLNVFIDRQPYPSWILNNTTYKYNAPIAMPSDGNLDPLLGGKSYYWDESTISWKEVIFPQ